MVIVITPEEDVADELNTVVRLLEQGLDRLHVRKPDQGKAALANYIQHIPEVFHQRISVHGTRRLSGVSSKIGCHYADRDQPNEIALESSVQSKSTHNWEDVLKCQENYDYLFLSPVFDSISKPGYSGKFKLSTLKYNLKRYSGTAKILALGGINKQTTARANEIGFHGVACLGHIWNHRTVSGRIEAWKEICSTIK